MKNIYRKITLALVIPMLCTGPLYAQTRTSFGGFRDTDAANTAGAGGNATNSYFGHQAGLVNTATFNTFIGYQSGLNTLTGMENSALGSRTLEGNTTGARNTANGIYALFGNTTGSENTGIGYSTLGFNTTGSGNIAAGTRALLQNTAGNYNSAVGYEALQNNFNSTDNTAFGYQSGRTNTNGVQNTFLGSGSGYNNQGSGNIFLGYQAGYNEASSNKLYIDNSNTATPLIWGDFDNNALNFNGDVAISGIATAPTAAAGTNSTQLATTAFVTAANAAAHTFPSYPDSAGDGGGNGNSYFGHEAGLVNTAVNNTFMGYQSGFSNTIATDNTAYGYQALRNNTTARRNTAIGTNALFTQSFSNGGVAWDTNNVAVGYEALYSNQPMGGETGRWNTAIGVHALYSNATGFQNSASGAQALFSNTTGNWNTGQGINALYWNTTGSYNTALGYWAGPNVGNYANTTALGYSAAITASNQVRIGNNNVTSIGGYVAWSNLSDGRFKKNLQEDVAGLSFIEQLRPVSYEMDRPKLEQFLRGDATSTDPSSSQEAQAQTVSSRVIGFVAQEVEQIVNDNGYVFSGVDAPQNEHDHYSLRYAEFVVPLVKAIQEQQAMIAILQEEVAQLKKGR